ncbi:hypothetical protein ACFWWS_36495, partial [Streptomyces sp. NPDC059083]|uniref:hypothetical protein n=1 Tax=Streptomyces sp. NPDC059083 TaxID=3346721 RepID=UPI003686DE74
LCSDCTTELADALDGVPWLLEQLAVTELRQDRVSRGLRTGSRPEQPLPFDPDVAAIRAELDNAVTGWARHIAETRGVRGPSGSAGAAALWLGMHVAAVRLDEAAGEIHREITRLAEAALAAINPPPVPGFRGPCPTLLRTLQHEKPVECGEPLYVDAEASTVYSSNTSGADVDIAKFITCPRCNVRHDVAKLEQELLVRIGKQVFELPDLLRVLRELGQPIPRGTVVSWISRGQLKPRGHDGGRQLYRLDDVRRLRTLTSHPKGSTA